MSIPPLLFPCVIDALDTLSVDAEMHASYREGLALYAASQWQSALLCFREACASVAATPPTRPPLLVHSHSTQAGKSSISSSVLDVDSSISGNGVTNPSSSSSSSFAPALRIRARSTLTIELGAHHQQHVHRQRPQGSSELAEDKSSATSSGSDSSSHSPASASVPMIVYHDDDSLTSLPSTRPVSLSHVPSNYSFMPSAQRTLLAHYHNAVAACLISIYLHHQALPFAQAAAALAAEAEAAKASAQDVSHPQSQSLSVPSNSLILSSSVPASPAPSPLSSSHAASASHAFVSMRQREAKQHLYAAVDLSCDEPCVHYNLGVLQSHRQEFDVAVKSFRLAIKKQPSRAETHSNLGVAYLGLNEHNKALSAFAKSVALESSPSIIFNLATGCIRKKKWREAITYLKRAIELCPDASAATDHTVKSDAVAVAATENIQLLASLHCQLAFCHEQSSLWTDCIEQSSLSLSISMHPFPKALRNRAVAFAAEHLFVQALADAKLALDAIATQKSLKNKREFSVLAEELVAFMSSWRTSSTAVERNSNAASPVASPSRSIASNGSSPLLSTGSLFDQANEPASPNYAHITLNQHMSILDDVRKESSLEIEKLKAEVRALSVNANAPSQQSKMMAIMCVICLAQQRSQLFSPCNHLLCCETCGMLVRLCPFCKAPIKKRKGPIYM